MRCYTLTERDELIRGICITRNDAGDFGVVIGSTLIPLEPRINAHLKACEDALYARAFGNNTPAAILGETTEAVLSEDDAKDVLEEVIEGWFVDHLELSDEGELVNTQYDPQETRCLLLVAPSIDAGGFVTYQSNISAGSLKAFAPISMAVGLTKLAGNGDKNLLKLDENASFRVHRQGCRTGWDVCTVKWNGRVLRKRAFTYNSAAVRALSLRIAA